MSKRPVILLGNGVRGNPALIDFLCSQNIPVLTAWMGADLIAEDNPAYCGRPGIFGQRAANIIQQKADEIRVFGARLDGEQVAYAYDRFAPNARQKLFIDADMMECARMKAYGWDVTVADLSKEFQPPYQDPYNLDGSWLVWCRALYARFRPELDGYCDAGNPSVFFGNEFVNPFYLMTLLHEYSLPSDIFAIGSSGNAPTVFFQSYKVKAGQRISNVCTIGSMGADIPMALGAALANPGKRVICVTGDGGFHMNAQELEVIRRLHLPITFFVFNNNGYNSIRVAQMARFGRVTGADPSSGLTLPEIDLIARAYGIAYKPLHGADLGTFGECFTDAPMIVEVFVDPEWQQLPRVMASTVNGQLRTDDMEDMTPKLPEDELKEIMEWNG